MTQRIDNTRANPLIVFCADASQETGTGHIRRCASIAEYLESTGYKCALLTAPESKRALPLDTLFSEVIEFGRDDGRGLSKLAPLAPNLLVLDNYSLGAPEEQGYRALGCPLAVIDDLADRLHDCDLLIDGNFGRNASDYDGLVPVTAKLLIGQEYQIVRSEFARFRDDVCNRHFNNDSILRILLCLGGTDSFQLTPKILKALNNLDIPLSITTVLGAGSAAIEATQKMEFHSGVEHHLCIQTKRMADLMMQSDLAIGAGGTMTWERNYLALPSILLVLAENQRLVAEHMKATDAAIVIDFQNQAPVSEIAQWVQHLNGNRPRLADLSANALALRSADGIENIARALVKLASERRSA